MHTIAAIACVVACLPSQQAQAKTYQLTFTATHFTSVLAPAPAPQDPVSGSIIFQADALGQPVTSIGAIDLSIAGHSYSLADLAFENWQGAPFPPSYTFGGKGNGAGGVAPGVNDFFITLSGVSGYHDISFLYSVAGTAQSSWIAYNYSDRFPSDIISSIVEIPTAVPEPSQALLLVAGMALFAGRLRAHRKT
ncbi:hypothetical protein [Roseateles sp. P5_E1]